jgi:transglutaminase-like putative cysteine protease
VGHPRARCDRAAWRYDAAVKRFAPIAAISLFALAASADEGAPIVAHEYVPDLGGDEGTLLVSSGGAQPEAIVSQGEVVPAPEGGALREDEQPMRASPGDGESGEEAGRRSPSFAPDRQTILRGRIGYYEVFSPTLSPFKRVTAYDAVALASDGTPILTIADPTRRAVEILGSDAPAENDRPRDQFWGSVVLDFTEGATVPFPSVSPEARILTLSTEPVALIRIEKDAADNFYATSSGRGQIRVVFLTDAPRDYFGTPLPDGPVNGSSHLVRPLPASVQRDAETFAAELGISRDTPFARALDILVEHFRSFEESEQGPPDTGNIYLDLARGRRGICRHRAYAFVITAQALGIYARFVQNEAHAWAEVDLLGRGFLRVDLGGAATGIESRGEEDSPSYQPTVEDPLPRPEEYERAYEEARRMSGMRSVEGPGEPSEAEAGEEGDPNGPAPSPVPLPPPSDGARQPLALELDSRRFEVFRGREIEITGLARGSGDASGLRIEVVLRAPRGNAEWLLGVTVTREAGRFRGVFGVPPDLGVGDYRLLVRTPGNRRFAPAQVE